MFTTPVIRPIKPFDATVGNLFKFDVQSGPQVVRNKLTIKDNSTGLVVYEATQETFLYQHDLPPSATLPIAEQLINGKDYQASIMVGDILNNWSAPSEVEIFWVFSPPTLTNTNIDEFNRIYNQTEIFTTTYAHLQNELLQSYRYLLYNENQGLITSFPEVFADGSLPLTQEIAGLNNGLTYFVEVRTLSQNGQEATTGLLEFTPMYIVPRLLTTLTVENDFDKGAIKLTANILQIILKLYDTVGNEIPPENIVYTDNTWIDMNNINYNKMVGTDGFSILQNDFMFQMWVKNLIENETIFRLIAPSGEIYGTYYGNRIHIFKKVNGIDIIPHFASEEFVLTLPDDTVVFRFDQKNNSIDINVTVEGGGV